MVMDEVKRTKLRVMERAAGLMGRDELARFLGIAKFQLEGCMRGDITIGDDQLLNLSRELDRMSRRRSASAGARST